MKISITHHRVTHNISNASHCWGWVRVTIPQEIIFPKNAPNASTMRNKWLRACFWKWLQATLQQARGARRLVKQHLHKVCLLSAPRNLQHAAREARRHHNTNPFHWEIYFTLRPAMAASGYKRQSPESDRIPRMAHHRSDRL